MGQWQTPQYNRRPRKAPWVVRSLAFQLATRLPDYRKLLLTLPEIAELDRKDAVELFNPLANPLRDVISPHAREISWRNCTSVKFSRKSHERFMNINS